MPISTRTSTPCAWRFRRLVNLVPRNGMLLLGADSPHAASLIAHAVSPVQTFGTSDEATWQASAIEHADGVTRFTVRRNGEPFGQFESPLLGLHNVRNALAAIAVGGHVGLRASTACRGLERLQGHQAAARDRRRPSRRDSAR